VIGADAATIEQRRRLSGMWQRGELSLEDFAEQMQRGELRRTDAFSCRRTAVRARRDIHYAVFRTTISSSVRRVVTPVQA